MEVKFIHIRAKKQTPTGRLQSIPVVTFAVTEAGADRVRYGCAVVGQRDNFRYRSARNIAREKLNLVPETEIKLVTVEFKKYRGSRHNSQMNEVVFRLRVRDVGHAGMETVDDFEHMIKIVREELETLILL